MKKIIAMVLSAGSFGLATGTAWAAEDLSAVASAKADFPKPYSAPCVERENVFEFTEKPKVKNLGNDKYEIAFAVKGNCDVTVGIVDAEGKVVRHLGAGVLGANAPAPFQKNSLKQTISWNGKDDWNVYHQTPEKLKVRVMLGLKPEFDKRLGITNPKSIPGFPYGIGIDESGAYLFYMKQTAYCFDNGRIRKFDHDGNYVRTLVPPPANLPEGKLQGLGFIEYEAGQKALQKPDLTSTWNEEAAGSLPTRGSLAYSCQVAIVGGRIYYSSFSGESSGLNYVRTDGSFEAEGVKGRLLIGKGRTRPYLAASPDGKWMYLGGDDTSQAYGEASLNAVFRCSLENDKPGAVFVGGGGMGSDNSHLNSVRGIDCDSQGRLYVCDHDNSRLQVFTPDGKYAKTITIDRPVQVRVHQKTGAIYVMYTTRVQGASINRISKLTSYDNPTIEFSLDCSAGLMALDVWTAKLRLWLYGRTEGLMEGRWDLGQSLRIYEEDGKQFRKIADFDEEVNAELKKAGVKAPGAWSGSVRADGGKIVCDPVREQVYYQNSHKFDLRTGAWLGDVRLTGNDIAFDKRGYLHCHFQPDPAGVGRLDPSRPGGGPQGCSYPECPYDYGVEGNNGWLGVLPVRDQAGAKFFQDGIGVNMMGDVAENCNIYYAPKRADETRSFFFFEGASGNPDTAYAAFNAGIQRRAKEGVDVYWIRPKPGVPLTGATIWTFERNGELRDECAVTIGNKMCGVMIDEEGDLYFVCNRTRLVNGKPFLAGRCGIFGAGLNAKAPDPFSGTLIKTGRKATILSTSAAIPLEERPKRPPELSQYREEAWCEGPEWLYAGAGGIVQAGCSCPMMRFHTDWYKRTFLPEKYRHSIGVVDTAGNLILHIGQYGNFDSGYGPASKVPVGGDGIAMSEARFVSGTDNYLCFSDRGERIIVLKLNYHAEETAGIQ